MKSTRVLEEVVGITFSPKPVQTVTARKCDKVVFKCVDIVAEDLSEGAQVVVYRRNYLEK